jgi:hypothetical protein
MLNKTTSTMKLLGRAAARFNNEVAGSGCGEVKHDFKIDDILDGFLSAR